MINRRCSIPRGRVLGGSSTINGLVYSRGHRYDYDAWEALGNKGWSYKDVLPYFIKSEDSRVNGDPGYHGRGGYWSVEYHTPISQQLTSFIEASREVYGYHGEDYNGRDTIGMFIAQLNNRNGRRHSTATAFLEPVQKRKNLQILMNSYVTKVLIRGKTAYGVLFANGDKLYAAYANKEVIVSGGSINSPQILMLSGIGPEKHLTELGIPVVQDLPVGVTLQDHATYFALYIQTNLTEQVQTTRQNIEQYLDRYGPYTIALNSQGVGFFQSTFMNIPGYPDIEFEFIPSNSTSDFIQRSFKYTDETYQSLWPRIDGQRSFNVYIVLLKPRSVGNVRLKSSDPYEYPLVDENSLSDPEGIDIETMYQGVQIMERLLDTEPMRRLNASIVYGDFRQCRDYVLGTREYWYCLFRLLTAQLYHPIATCKMGPNPHTAVVDNRLRVYGIRGLRVADCSIMPLLISGHTNAPAVMVGEKVSDFIKMEYGKPTEPLVNVWHDT